MTFKSPRPAFAIPALAALLALAACGKPSLQGLVAPREAIAAATADPDGEARGTFAFVIRRVEAAGGKVFLNSETDYRRSDCLTVVVPPPVMATFLASQGLGPLDDLRGRTLHVRGRAQRTKVVFMEQGVATDRFYFQTHVRVTDRAQLELAPR